MSSKTSCDVIIIGGGSAALEAAISARQSGADSVVMIEKAPRHESGGNAQFSHVGFRFVHSGAEELRGFFPQVPEERFRRMQIPAYTPQNFLDDLLRVTQGRIDPVLSRCLIDHSNAAVHWMQDIGVTWEPEKVTEVDGKLYLPGGHHIHPIGGGPGMLDQLRDIAFKRNAVEIRYDSRVRAIHGNDRRVEGVRVSAADGEYDLEGRAVIVCSGGFQANAEMRARYLGPNADLMKVRGSKHNTGEVLNMLLALGVKSAGHWQGAHMSPIDGKAPNVETPVMKDGHGNSMNRYDYQFGITVNALGQRFYDEGEAKHAYTYAKTGRLVLQQPGGVAYQIYDQTGIDLFRHGRDYAATMVEAPALDELAVKIGIEVEPFMQTIKEFNAACRTDVAFMPGELDGKGTVGLTPKKSNWAMPIVKGPFRAYPITGGVTFSFGGIGVDPQARVVNTCNEPIRGLYASGDVIGLFFHNYPSCTGQTRNAVFSYLAGRGAGAMLARGTERDIAMAKAPHGPRAIEKLAEWALAARASDIPAATVTQTKLLLLDTIGCGFAALDEDGAEAVLNTLKEIGGTPQCTVLGSTEKTSAPNAVLVNGSLIRFLDLNDYVNTKSGQIGGHPSDNIPVALAAGEISNAAGRDVIAAIVVGYEIYGRLKELMDRNSDWDGVTVSGFVAPAMAGRLLGLDVRQLAQALALSGARAITPLAVRHGDISGAKNVANALVAQNGMQATILAKHGMTGPLDLFENKHGLKSVFPGLNWMETITAPLPADSYIMGCHMKAFPCLATGQGVVAAGLELHNQVGGDVDKLKQITVAIADTPSLQRQKDDPGRIDPHSREAADHSFNFLAAVALVDGDFGLDTFDNERWNDPKVRAVMARLSIACDGSLNARSPGAFPCAIRATGTDGRAYLAEVLDPPGFSRHGIDANAVLRKFNSVTTHRLGPSSRQRIIDAAMAFDASASCAQLTDALAKATKA